MYPLGSQQVMAPVIGFLQPTWETCIQFLPTGFSMDQQWPRQTEWAASEYMRTLNAYLSHTDQGEIGTGRKAEGKKQTTECTLARHKKWWKCKRRSMYLANVLAITLPMLHQTVKANFPRSFSLNTSHLPWFHVFKSYLGILHFSSRV